MAVVSGVAYWACVQQPNTLYDPKWTIEVLMDAAEAKALKTAMEEFADEKGLRKANFQEIKKDEDRGGFSVRIENKVERADGTKNDPPRVVDASGEPFDKLIGNGSTVKVLYRIYKSTFRNKDYVKLGLKAVKVIDLVPYGDSADDDFFKSEDGAAKPSKVSKKQEEDFDDEL